MQLHLGQAPAPAAIDAIEPTDGSSRLGEAVTVARAFAQSPGVEANNRSAETAAQLELFSDGRIRTWTALWSAPAS